LTGFHKHTDGALDYRIFFGVPPRRYGSGSVSFGRAYRLGALHRLRRPTATSREDARKNYIVAFIPRELSIDAALFHVRKQCFATFRQVY
jgi:hypothetical protein